MHVEVRHDVLVENLKDKPCRVIFGKQEEECLKACDVKKETHDENKFGMKIEYFDEYDLDSVTDDEKYLLRSMFDG